MLNVSVCSSDKTTNATYHKSYRCSGINVCGLVHPDVITPCSAYDRVKLENLHDLRHRIGGAPAKFDVDVAIRRDTEA